MINPNYITGFVDGEGSFHIAIYKDKNTKQGIKIIPEFHISQRDNSKSILYEIKDYFSCGYVKENHPTNLRDRTYVYVVRNRDDLLKIIIPFFKKYKLQTNKAEDFSKFVKVVNLLSQNIHSTNKE